MLDFFNLPTGLSNADVQVFTCGSGPIGIGFNPYNVPRGKSMLYIYAVGAGAGGGGGFSGTAGTARGGGGGGGSGGVATFLGSTVFLPSRLYVYVGPGGQGGAANTAGSNGGRSFVTIEPSSVAPTNVLLYTGNASSTGGGAGTGAAAGTGGAGDTVATIANMPLAGLGLWNSFAGQAGTNGGSQTGTNGISIGIPAGGYNVMGGTGGGGTTSADFTGGGITGVSSSLISDARPQTSASGSSNGSGGFTLQYPFWNFGGLGGGSSNTGVGGNGGNGGIGSGGGGGGAGTTGGRGGDGGAGMVIMIAW